MSSSPKDPGSPTDTGNYPGPTNTHDTPGCPSGPGGGPPRPHPYLRHSLFYRLARALPPFLAGAYRESLTARGLAGLRSSRATWESRLALAWPGSLAYRWPAGLYRWLQKRLARFFLEIVPGSRIIRWTRGLARAFLPHPPVPGRRRLSLFLAFLVLGELALHLLREPWSPVGTCSRLLLLVLAGYTAINCHRKAEMASSGASRGTRQEKI